MTHYHKLLILSTLFSTLFLISAPAKAEQMRNGLPPVSTDSFVQQAAEQGENIYGDEGFTGPPPFYGFTTDHRINSGITGRRDAGLTTGHGEYLPDAWGADEFLAPPDGEWSLAGANGGDSQNNHGAAFLDSWDALAPARAKYWDQQLQALQAQRARDVWLKQQKMNPNAPVVSSPAEKLISPASSLTNYDVASKFYSPDSFWDIGGKKYIVDYGTPQQPKAVVIPTGF